MALQGGTCKRARDKCQVAEEAWGRQGVHANDDDARDPVTLEEGHSPWYYEPAPIEHRGGQARIARVAMYS